LRAPPNNSWTYILTSSTLDLDVNFSSWELIVSTCRSPWGLEKTFNFETSTKTFDFIFLIKKLEWERKWVLHYIITCYTSLSFPFILPNKTKQNKPNLVLNIVRFWRDIIIRCLISLSLWDLASGNENSGHIFLFAFGDSLSVQFFLKQDLYVFSETQYTRDTQVCTKYKHGMCVLCPLLTKPVVLKSIRQW
jgi:hypothetical protein